MLGFKLNTIRLPAPLAAVLLLVSGIPAAAQSPGRCLDGNCRDGLGVEMYQGVRYEGEFQNGQWRGFGRAKMEDGTVILGMYTPQGLDGFVYQISGSNVTKLLLDEGELLSSSRVPENEARHIRIANLLNREFFVPGRRLIWFEYESRGHKWRVTRVNLRNNRIIVHIPLAETIVTGARDDERLFGFRCVDEAACLRVQFRGDARPSKYTNMRGRPDMEHAMVRTVLDAAHRAARMSAD